nr:DUF6414 family protein [uncultured Methanobacterium sp.]
MSKKEGKMTKIVYFDEIGATDYLTINGELIEQIITELSENKKNLEAGTKLKGWVKASIWPFVGGSVEGNVKAGIEKNNSNIVKTTISNSLLSDFLEKRGNDIEELNNYYLKPYPNSIAFFKMFTPYLKMFSKDFKIDDGAPLEMHNMDDAFEYGKGYYEMIANPKVEEENENKKILRFNIKAFRNNYTIADLTKMDLTYYIVKVGRANEDSLDISKEFNMGENLVSLDDLENGKNGDEKALDVYDVILAGVSINEN